VNPRDIIEAADPVHPSAPKPMTRHEAGNLTDKPSPGHDPYFRIFMPYLFQQVEYLGIKNVYLPLNRDYHPIGVRSGFADYADYIETHAVHLPRDASSYPDIWFSARGRSFWLYDDSSASRIDYFDRLQRLLCKGLPLIDPSGPRIRCLKAEAARKNRVSAIGAQGAAE